MPLIALAVGAGVGLLKSEAIDRPKEKRQRKLAAETQRLSPWTGMSADKISEADPLASAIQFGATGAQVQGGMAQQDINNKMAEKALAGQANTQVNANMQQPNYSVGGADAPWYQKRNPWDMGYGG